MKVGLAAKSFNLDGVWLSRSGKVWALESDAPYLAVCSRELLVAAPSH